MDLPWACLRDAFDRIITWVFLWVSLSMGSKRTELPLHCMLLKIQCKCMQHIVEEVNEGTGMKLASVLYELESHL